MLEECFEVSKLWSLLQTLTQALMYGTWGTLSSLETPPLSPQDRFSHLPHILTKAVAI